MEILQSVERLHPKDAKGKKFGTPKRLANDIIINIKIKCNQAQEGLMFLFEKLKNYIKDFNELKGKEEIAAALMKNDLPLNIRKQLQKINTCVWNYGKYINAFKETLLNSYQLNRVLIKENIEDCTIVEKEDMDADELLKKEELLGLGFLAQSILDPNSSSNSGDKLSHISPRHSPRYDNNTHEDKLSKIYEFKELTKGQGPRFVNGSYFSKGFHSKPFVVRNGTAEHREGNYDEIEVQSEDVLPITLEVMGTHTLPPDYKNNSKTFTHPFLIREKRKDSTSIGTGPIYINRTRDFV